MCTSNSFLVSLNKPRRIINTYNRWQYCDVAGVYALAGRFSLEVMMTLELVFDSTVTVHLWLDVMA